MARRGPGGQPRIRTISPHLSVPPKGQELSHIRGTERRRGISAGPERQALYGRLRPGCHGACIKGYCGTRHRYRAQTYRCRLCFSGHQSQAGCVHQGPVSHHLRKIALSRNRYHQGTHTCGTRSPLHVWRSGHRSLGPHGSRGTLCHWGDGVYWISRRQSPGLQFPFGRRGHGPKGLHPDRERVQGYFIHEGPRTP